VRRLLLTLALGISWGSSFLWIKYALDSFSPTVITTVRLILGAAVCYAFCLATHVRLPRRAKVLLPLLGAGILANALPYTLFAVGEQRTSSAIAGLMNSTAPLWTLLVGWIIHDRAVGKRSTIGVFIGLMGTVLMVTPALTVAQGDLPGVVACLGASLCYGLSYIYIDRFIPNHQYSLPALAAGQLTGAVIASLPFAFLVDHYIKEIHARSFGSLLVLGIIGTGVAYIVNYELIRSTGPIAASVVSYLIPVVAVMLSVLVLSESLSAWSIIGGVITLFGVSMAHSRERIPHHPRVAGETN
jgi:drug/metabolite transporter (DMT)-like permease